MNIKQYSKGKPATRQVIFDVTALIRGVVRLSREEAALTTMFGRLPDRNDAIACVVQLLLDRIAESRSHVMSANLGELVTLVVGHRSFKAKLDANVVAMVENIVKPFYRVASIFDTIPEPLYYSPAGGKLIRVVQSLFGEKFYIAYDLDSIQEEDK